MLSGKKWGRHPPARGQMTKTETEFDRAATSYVQDVNRAVPFWAGEANKFTRIKAAHLRQKLAEYSSGQTPLTLLDAGCGIGLTDEYLKPFFPNLHGFDVSRESVRLAAIRNPEVRYLHASGGKFPYPDGKFDAVFAICVLHHVPPGERLLFLKEVLRVLRPGGCFLGYEHNPHHPMTRWVVGRCQFDKHAVLLSPREGRQLLVQAGFERPSSDFLAFLPWASAGWVAWEARWLSRLPLGAQHVFSAAKPRNSRMDGQSG